MKGGGELIDRACIKIRNHVEGTTTAKPGQCERVPMKQICQQPKKQGIEIGCIEGSRVWVNISSQVTNSIGCPSKGKRGIETMKRGQSNKIEGAEDLDKLI